LFDLGFYDFWLFDRIDANDGWFVSRVKSNANPEIIEELRTWRGSSITLVWRKYRAILS
jgi:IS4 transposase